MTRGIITAPQPEAVEKLVLLILQDGGNAVSAPRFTANSNGIDVTNRIPRYITKELEKKGYELIRNPFSYGFAGVHGIRVKDGIWDGGADSGRDGMVLTV